MSTVRATVERFDDHRGDGMALGEDGQSYYFHCVEIADGTRTVAVGAKVIGVRRPGRLGFDELAELQSVDG